MCFRAFMYIFIASIPLLGCSALQAQSSPNNFILDAEKLSFNTKDLAFVERFLSIHLIPEDSKYSTISYEARAILNDERGSILYRKHDKYDIMEATSIIDWLGFSKNVCVTAQDLNSNQYVSYMIMTPHSATIPAEYNMTYTKEFEKSRVTFFFKNGSNCSLRLVISNR